MKAISMNEFLKMSLGYILRCIIQRKKMEKKEDEMLNRFWHWLRPRFIEEIPETKHQYNQEDLEIKLEQRLEELIKDERFFKEMLNWLDKLMKTSIRGKELIHKDIWHAKVISVGEREYYPSDIIDSKDIVGSV
jgi:hypothetical protein